MSYLDGDALTAEGMQRVMTEVSLGIDPADSRLPDTDAVREFRNQVAMDMAAILADGDAIDYDGTEFPG